MITFEIPGEPMSKERPRHARGHTYTPARTIAAEARILTAWLAQRDRRMYYGDIAVTINFHSATRIRRDLDNMAKLCLDALNKHAYCDDSQIQALRITRRYVPKGTASTTITITELS